MRVKPGSNLRMDNALCNLHILLIEPSDERRISWTVELEMLGGEVLAVANAAQADNALKFYAITHAIVPALLLNATPTLAKSLIANRCSVFIIGAYAISDQHLGNWVVGKDTVGHVLEFLKTYPS